MSLVHIAWVWEDSSLGVRYLFTVLFLYFYAALKKIKAVYPH